MKNERESKKRPVKARPQRQADEAEKSETDCGHDGEESRAGSDQQRDLFENAPIAYFSVGTDGLIRRCNRYAEKMLGYTMEQLLGRPIFGLYADTPQGKRRASEVFERFRAGETVITEELEMQDAGGKAFWVSVSVNSLRDGCGRVVESRSIVVDIRERKKAEEALRGSEQRFRSLVETTSDWVWEIDRDGFYRYTSPKVRDLLGYEPEEVVGKRPFDFMPPDERERIRNLFTGIVEARKPFSALENVNVRKDGRRIVLETSGIPIFDEKGNFSGYRGIDRDITDRKQAEQEREELILELKEALSRIKTLNGLLPICASCKKIRNDRGYWEQIETYIRDHSEAQFSHGICPDCAKSLYPEYMKKK
jgi:PAS domain S-box-containing protein